MRKQTDPRYKVKTYLAKIVFEGKSIFLGCFETAEQASAAYEAKAKELFGEFYTPQPIGGEAHGDGNEGNNQT